MGFVRFLADVGEAAQVRSKFQAQHMSMKCFLGHCTLVMAGVFEPKLGFLLRLFPCEMRSRALA